MYHLRAQVRASDLYPRLKIGKGKVVYNLSIMMMIHTLMKFLKKHKKISETFKMKQEKRRQKK